MWHTRIDWLTALPPPSRNVQLVPKKSSFFFFYSFYQNTTSTNKSILHSNSLHQSPQQLTPSATMPSSAASTLLNGHATTSIGSSRLFNGHPDVGGLRSDNYNNHNHRQPLDWFDKFKDISVKEEPADADRWDYLFESIFNFEMFGCLKVLGSLV